MFGIDNNLSDGKKMQSVSESNTCSNARIIGPNGEPVEQTTFGAMTTKTNEYYLGETDVYVNGATSGQTGQSIVTNSTRTSFNQDYQRVSETIEICPTITGGSAATAGTNT